ncbi:MAG: hydrolase [Thalassotalea sp.]
MFCSSQFKPAWWLSNAHAQTMFAKFLQKKTSAIRLTETVETPDGDFFDLAWTEPPEKDTSKPIVVILHGLEGSQNSHYARGMLNAVVNNGWVGLLMHFRGCSGKPNRQLNSYHSGDIRDISFLTEQLSKQFPARKLGLIGFSLGGNIASLYLANNPDNPYKAACIICAPFDLASCSKKINRGVSKIYQQYLVGMLKDSTLIKHQVMPNANICPLKIKAIKTMWQFDDYVTAPINGFDNALDYYDKVSGIHVLDKVVTPSLIIHAQDDPFLDHEKITAVTSLPASIRFEISEKGGHVGFISGNNPLKPEFWLEKRVPQYLSEFL